MTISIDDFLERLVAIDEPEPWRIASLMIVDHDDRRAAAVLRAIVDLAGPEATIGDIEESLYNALWWLRLHSAHTWAKSQIAAAVFTKDEIRNGPIEQVPASEGHP